MSVAGSIKIGTVSVPTAEYAIGASAILGIRDSGKTVTEDGRGDFAITEYGLNALASYEPLPEGRALLEYWLRELGSSGAARMLEVLAEAYPNALTKEALGERANISHTSGTFSNYLSKLRTLELVEGSRGEIRASKEFFE